MSAARTSRANTTSHRPDTQIAERIEGGLDDEGGINDDARLQQQLALIKRLDCDLLGLQEATWGARSPRTAEAVAAELGMDWKFLGPSNFYGCDLAAFVRVGDHLTVDDVTYLTGPPFVHGLANVTLRIKGHPRPVQFLVGHSAPSAPTARLAEAEMITVHRKQDAIYVADCNAISLTDDLEVSGIDPVKAGKLDTRPAQALAAAGLLDVGALLGDRTPTVGHHREDSLAFRCDRIHTNLPAAWITGYGVETGGDHLSDHRPVWAEITFGETGGPTS